MGKFADSMTPKEGAKPSPDPIPHALRDEPVSIASQGMRTTAALKEYVPPKDLPEVRTAKSGVAGLREDFVESPEKKKADEIEAKAMQEQNAAEVKAREEKEKAKPKVAVAAPVPPHSAR